MTSKPRTVSPSDTLELAHQKMEAGRFRQVPVVEEGRLVGILTDRDTRQHLGQLAHTRVDAVMSAHPFSVPPSAAVEKAAHVLITNKIGSLPVVEDGKLIGIITATDMLRVLEAVLGDDSTCRIDLNLEDSGEITAATSLIQTICPILGIGTYRRNKAEREVLYVQVPSTSAQNAAQTLKQYGFKVIAVHS
jgi:acetoin utilization protein AcuB